MKNLDYLIEELIKEDKKLSDIEIPKLIEEKKELYRALRNIRNPKPISEEYLKIQDEYLTEEIKNKGIVDEKDISFNSDIISIWQGDITTLKVDCIVNAGNEYLLGCFIPNHSCIDNAIHSFAGIELRQECNDIMQGKTLDNGKVILTNGYNLPSKYVIHTCGPKINNNVTKKDEEDLKNCYLNTLELCKEKGIKTIAFPCISTGLYGFPQKLASKIAINTVLEYIKKYKCFDHIIFNVFKDTDYKLYSEWLNYVSDIFMIFHLNDEVYKIIKNGDKDIEMRVNDEKRRLLKIGDKILFINRDNEEEYIKTKIIDLKYYNNFLELIDNYEMKRVYLNNYTKEKLIEELNKFYTKEEQDKYGVVAINFIKE